MIIPLKDLRAGTGVIHLHESVDLSRIVEDRVHIVRLTPVDTQVSATKSGMLIQVIGELKTTVTYPCSRCLEPFDEPIATELRESFQEGQATEDTKLDDDVHVVAGDEILLDPYIEQAIYLALDFHPICSPNCRGLCPNCGCNRNIDECGCNTRKIDPRFAVLQDLISRDESE